MGNIYNTAVCVLFIVKHQAPKQRVDTSSFWKWKVRSRDRNVGNQMKTMPKFNSKLSLELGDLCLGLRLGRWGYVVRLHCCWGKELDEEKSRDAYI